MKNKTNEYAVAVCDAVTSLFKGEEQINIMHFDLDKINATEFFTGAIMGIGVLYNQLTGDKKDMLQFSYLVNQLIVQDMLKEESK